MFKEWFTSETVDVLSNIGLLLFFGIFALAVIWAFSRRKRDIKRWSELPLDE